MNRFFKMTIGGVTLLSPLCLWGCLGSQIVMHDVPDGSQSQTHGYFNIDAPAFQTLTPGSVGNDARRVGPNQSIGQALLESTN